MRAHRIDLNQLVLRQRTLRGAQNISTAWDILGTSCEMPVLLGPVGIAGRLKYADNDH
ncbi:MAG: hypothetical protein CBC09_06375 [Cellvibrionales bacterium TMED49]|nr:MAG: hypothetical protein CBC09_06375 [Cellvibrionales bacterium TMED49]